MTIRTGHGEGAGRPHVEVLPPDELPPASPALAGRTDRDAHGRFVRGNTAQRAKLVRPGPRGHAAIAIEPTYEPFERWGRRYAAHRRTELARAHGGELSAGVAALVESAGTQLAASRFVHAKAAETGDPEMFKRASALACDARQNELAAWEVAAREAPSRPRVPGNARESEATLPTTREQAIRAITLRMRKNQWDTELSPEETSAAWRIPRVDVDGFAVEALRRLTRECATGDAPRTEAILALRQIIAEGLTPRVTADAARALAGFLSAETSQSNRLAGVTDDEKRRLIKDGEALMAELRAELGDEAEDAELPRRTPGAPTDKGER